MTYQQSLENIKATINFVRIYDKDEIFFDFSNETDFKIIFYDRETELEKIQKLAGERLNNNLAAVMIMLRYDEQEYFLYSDANLDYEYNLTTSELVYDNSNDDYIKQSAAQIKLQVAQLIAKLKQM